MVKYIHEYNEVIHKYICLFRSLGIVCIEMVEGEPRFARESSCAKTMQCILRNAPARLDESHYSTEFCSFVE